MMTWRHRGNATSDALARRPGHGCRFGPRPSALACCCAWLCLLLPWVVAFPAAAQRQFESVRQPVEMTRLSQDMQIAMGLIALPCPVADEFRTTGRIQFGPGKALGAGEFAAPKGRFLRIDRAQVRSLVPRFSSASVGTWTLGAFGMKDMVREEAGWINPPIWQYPSRNRWEGGRGQPLFADKGRTVLVQAIRSGDVAAAQEAGFIIDGCLVDALPSLLQPPRASVRTIR